MSDNQLLKGASQTAIRKQIAFGNTITIRDKAYRLYGAPLDQYWEKYRNRPAFIFTSSPLDQGYEAFWELRDGQLYLQHFEGRRLMKGEAITFEEAFPGKSLPLLAYWYCGTLSVQTGEVIGSTHHFGQTLAYRMNLSFRNGVLMDTIMEDAI